MRDALKKGIPYKQDVHVSLREYGSNEIVKQNHRMVGVYLLQILFMEYVSGIRTPPGGIPEQQSVFSSPLTMQYTPS